MNRTALITIVSAIIIAAVIGVGAMMLLGSDGTMNHQMDDGSTMTGPTMTGMMNNGTSP